MISSREINCVVVGDPVVGKTRMLYSFTLGVFPEHIPTVFDWPDFTHRMTVDGIPVTLGIFDMPGHDTYDRLRPLTYIIKPPIEIVIICFSIVSPSSFNRVTSKWYPEMKQYCKRAPIILVGTKMDLREDAEAIRILSQCGQKPLEVEQGKALADSIKAVKYFECSALLHTGTTQIFEEAVRAVLRNDEAKPSKRKCVII